MGDKHSDDAVTAEWTSIQFSVSPNPANGQVRFDLDWSSENSTKFADLLIVNVHGSEVYHTRVLAGQQYLYWHPAVTLEGVFYVYLQTADVRPQAPQRIVLIH